MTVRCSSRKDGRSSRLHLQDWGGASLPIRPGPGQRPARIPLPSSGPCPCGLPGARKRQTFFSSPKGPLRQQSTVEARPPPCAGQYRHYLLCVAAALAGGRSRHGPPADSAQAFRAGYEGFSDQERRVPSSRGSRAVPRLSPLPTPCDTLFFHRETSHRAFPRS